MILNIAKLNLELSALRNEKTDWTKVQTSMEADKTATTKTIEDLTAKVKELETQLAGAKKEEAAVVIATVEAVEQKVVQKLATLGVKEGTIADAPVTVTLSTDPAELYKQYDNLKGAEKVAFFQKNERAILTGMKMFHYNPITKKN